MLEKYLVEQEITTKLLLKSLEENRISQAYLFVCDDIEYIYNYAKEFTKEIIKKSNLDENTLNNIYLRIDNNEYTELKIVEPSGNYIKKEQLLDLQNSVLNKPIEANKIVYIIKNVEKFTSASANSILKFLEEPEEDIIAILLTDNLNMVIPTIKSRCQVLNFKSVKDNLDIKKLLIPINIEKAEEEINNLIESSLEIIKSLENKKINTFIYYKNLFIDKLKTNEDILIFLNFSLYLYVDSMNKKLNKEVKYMKDYMNFIDIIVENNDINDIITKINIFEEVKNNLNSNVNSKLLFDKIIIELSEV